MCFCTDFKLQCTDLMSVWLLQQFHWQLQIMMLPPSRWTSATMFLCSSAYCLTWPSHFPPEAFFHVLSCKLSRSWVSFFSLGPPSPGWCKTILMESVVEGSWDVPFRWGLQCGSSSALAKWLHRPVTCTYEQVFELMSLESAELYKWLQDTFLSVNHPLPQICTEFHGLII